MALVLQRSIVEQLKKLGCDTNEKAPLHEHGLGQWWITGSGSKFYVQWANEDGHVDDRILERILRTIRRAFTN